MKLNFDRSEEISLMLTDFLCVLVLPVLLGNFCLPINVVEDNAAILLCVNRLCVNTGFVQCF